jgi:hypothetical protein
MIWHRFRTARSVMALAALIALPLVACGGDNNAETETVEITGTTGNCVEDDFGGPGGAYTQTCPDVQMSDERASGVSELALDCELTQEGDATNGVCSGPITVSNDGGTWEGTVEVAVSWTTSEPAHMHVIDGTFLGTGDYDGLRMFQHLEGYGSPWTITGRIESVVSSNDVAAAIALVTAHNDAKNVHDREVLQATLTDDAVWLDNGDQLSLMTRDDYINIPPVEQTFTGEPTVVRDPTNSGDLQVSVPMNFVSQVHTWDGTMVYTLRKVDGEWMIAQLDRHSDE